MAEPTGQTTRPAADQFVDRELSAADLRRGQGFLRTIFALRVVMLAGSVGSFLGSLLMFWQGFLYLADAVEILGHRGDDVEHAATVTVPVLEAVDSFLFGVVLVIFAYGIAVGFVFRLPPNLLKVLPSWMKISGVGQLKAILAEVVVVVLIVIFARIVVEAGSHFEWSMLVLPVAIVLLSAAIWLLGLADHPEDDGNSDKPTDH